MVIKKKKIPIHWNYFLTLEEDLGRMSRFIDFSENNFNCYSIEMARLLMLACSEIDVVAKQLCKKVDRNVKAENINQYREILKPVFTNIPEFEVIIRRHGLSLTPWVKWKEDQNPLWWSSNNKVKHERNNHFPEANLKNTLNAIAGLYVIVLYMYAEEAKEGLLTPPPTQFGVGEKHYNGHHVSDYELTVCYQL